MPDFTFAHFIMEFLNTVLALAVAGAGFYWFIDKRINTVFRVVDVNKQKAEDDLKEYVRLDMHTKDIEHIKELNTAEIKSLVDIFQTELKFVNQKLDQLIRHDDARSGVK